MGETLRKTHETIGTLQRDTYGYFIAEPGGGTWWLKELLPDDVLGELCNFKITVEATPVGEEPPTTRHKFADGTLASLHEQLPEGPPLDDIKEVEILRELQEVVHAWCNLDRRTEYLRALRFAIKRLEGREKRPLHDIKEGEQPKRGEDTIGHSPS